MRKRLLLTVAGAALAVAPFAFRGGSTDQAMTCAADPPIDAACDVVFDVLAVVCNGQLPSPPPTTGPPIGVAMARPDLCPPLG